MPRKSKLKELKSTHGALPFKQINTLDELLGNNGRSKYRYLNDPFDCQEYKNYLNKLQPSDLNAHAAEFGLLGDTSDPSGRERLKNKLIAEFQLHAAKFKAPSNQNLDLEKAKNKDVSLEQIMAAGK